MSAGIIELYLQEIGKYRLLTESEEASLFRRILPGDEEAGEEMIQANLRLVVSIVKYYSDCGYATASVFQEALTLDSVGEAFDPPVSPGMDEANILCAARNCENGEKGRPHSAMISHVRLWLRAVKGNRNSVPQTV